MDIARKGPESDPDSSTRIQIPKPISFSNGVLKLNQHSGGGNNNNNGGGRGGEIGGVVYKECLKNHAASLGAHALDGCGEFMPSPAFNSADPTSLKCAACGCHRNFHRQETEESLPCTNTAAALEYQPHYRHHPPPPPSGEGGVNSSPSSDSPPPISSSYYPSAPHLFLTLSGGSTPVGNRTDPPMVNGRKRFRTRFTQNQKAKMLEYAEKLNWKMQRKDEEIINGFCNEIEVEKGVFKVWMHNNKNILGKREHSNSIPATQIQTPNSNSNPGTNNGNGTSFVHNNHQNHGIIQNHDINASNNKINHFNGDSVNCPNGSSSTS